MMYSDRADLLDRCLRLEARLLGVAVDPPPVVEPAPISTPAPLHRQHPQQRKVTPADIAQMRDLRARGLSYHAIALRLAFADSTVQRYVRDVQVTG